MDFTVCYENNAASNYMVLKTNKDEKLINYQSHMLLNNKIEGILDFNVNFTGDGWNCFYDVTSRCTLENYLSRKKFSRNEFLIALRIIINSIFNLQNYLLYNANILLDENYIFVEPETMKICFVYLPFHNCKNDIKAFFTKLVVGLVKFENEESDNYIQKILQILNSDLFSLSSLKQLTETLLGEGIRNDQEPLPSMESIVDKAKTDDRKIEKQMVFKGRVKIPGMNATRELKDEKAKNNKTSINTGSVRKFGIIPVALQPIIFMLFIFTLNSSIFEMSDNPKVTFLILLIIFISLDILIIRIIKEKKPYDKESYKPLKYIKDRMKITSQPTESNREYRKEPDVKQENQVCHGQTVVLKQQKPESSPYLKEKDGEEIIKIDKESILIGRMDSFVDYVISSNAIGKIHAEIMNEQGSYYVMDCNSRNGTYINGVRAVPNTKIKLSNNDEVRFANKEFILIY